MAFRTRNRARIRQTASQHAVRKMMVGITSELVLSMMVIELYTMTADTLASTYKNW